MTKKRKNESDPPGTFLPGIGLTMPDYSRIEHNQPKVDYERLKGLIKPQSESFQEAVKPLQEELILLRQQAELANKRAEEAEASAQVAERKANRAQTLSILITVIGIIIPVIQQILSTQDKQQEEKQRLALESTVAKLSKESQSLRSRLYTAEKNLERVERPTNRNVKK